MADKKFGTELFKLPEIFSNRKFQIPDYQRSYSWDEKQVKEMLDDIDHLISSELKLSHYTGTIVLSKADESKDNLYSVVDGQQRLTTIVILIKVLSPEIKDYERVQQTYLQRGELGSEESVLRLNTDIHEFFEKSILNNETTEESFESQSRLKNSKKIISKWLQSHISNNVSANYILEAIESKLGFMLYIPSDSAEIGIMFEVINNRGKELSELEKVKNYLIYCCAKLSASTLRKTIDSDWSKVIKNLNDAKKTHLNDEAAFLRYCVAVYLKSGKEDSQYGYDELKKHLKIDLAIKNQEAKTSTIKKIKDFLEFIKTASNWYAMLYGANRSKSNNELNLVLDQIQSQERQASIMPLFLAVCLKQSTTDEAKTYLLNVLEVLNFRVYIAKDVIGRNDSGQAELYKIASNYYHDIFNGTDKNRTHEQQLEWELVNFTLYYSGDRHFEKSFTLDPSDTSDFYKWNGLRYFLINYESYLQPNKTINPSDILKSRRDGKSGDYLSIEHLWATENRNGVGENDRPEDYFEKRRLGNFVLLELRSNIKGKNYWTPFKLNEYSNGIADYSVFKQVRDAHEHAKAIENEMRDNKKTKNYYKDFAHELNNRQESSYIKFALSRWSLEKFYGYDELKDKYVNTIED